jgi:hypothetical protein
MMGQSGVMYSLFFLAALTASGLAAAPLPVSESAARLCYNRVETREKVAAHGLRESLVLLREASSEFGADPLNARLCRNRDQFVYEMSLLRRDGRVVRLVVDAASGARLSARQARER